MENEATKTGGSGNSYQKSLFDFPSELHYNPGYSLTLPSDISMMGHSLLPHMTRNESPTPPVQLSLSREAGGLETRQSSSCNRRIAPKPPGQHEISPFPTKKNKNKWALPSGEGKYECESCKISFRRQADLSSHRRIHSNRFNCDKCSSFFPLEKDLSRHKKSVHPRPDDPKWKCPFQCIKSENFFNRKDNFTRHLRTYHPSIDEKEITHLVDECRVDGPS